MLATGWKAPSQSLPPTHPNYPSEQHTQALNPRALITRPLAYDRSLCLLY